MSRRICILTQSHLCRNPRVVKEANLLADNGFDVSILTTFTYAGLLAEDRQLLHPSVKLNGVVDVMPETSQKAYRLYARLQRRLAGEAVARLGWQNPYALGYDYGRNLRAALKTQADLYLCHQEASTIIGTVLLRKGRRVGFDFEDWYSHDLLPEANRTRPLRLLENAERFALRNAHLCYTTSHAMAEAMAEFAQAPKPQVLLNVFPLAEREWMDGRFLDRNDFRTPSLHWYSQTIGPGRGLEFIVECLNMIDVPVQLHLRGNIFGGYDQTLLGMLKPGKGHVIHFHGLVPHRELLSRIAEHDIGLATEEYNPPSRNLTITNKILQYLLAGIPVLASDTAGQKEVAAQARDAVDLFKGKDHGSFVAVLLDWLKQPEKLKARRETALSLAKEKFCWEVEGARLLGWVEQLLMH
ncbi:MAG: glycosyltransferase [Bacteroidetes bacterium]|nr:glycosyltransferase [Bacteroidota bacterium]